MQVAKWGNSLAIRIPAELVRKLELKEGDEVTVNVESKNIFALARKSERDIALDKIRAFRGKLPSDWRFDRDEANAR